MDKVSRDDLLKSLDIERNKEKIIKAGEGSGKSGSFFFFTSDNRYLIKTMNNAEKNKCLDSLDLLIQHFNQTDNESLIARIYGIFTLKTNHLIPINFMLMQNTSMLVNSKDKQFSFDLKGSWVDRLTKVEVKINNTERS